MPPGGNCVICTHPNVAEIDELLRSGEHTYREVADAYGISEFNTGVHARRHLKLSRGRTVRRTAALIKANRLRRDVALETPKPTSPVASETPDSLARSLGSLPKVTALPTRALTTSQRDAIRDHLDDHFDTKAGTYLHGWSDQRIGETLDIPWRYVADLREAAYGPLLVDPKISALQQRLDRQENRLEVLITEFGRSVEEVRKAIREIRYELDGSKEKSA
jgi:hypothetical protein